ncbi:MAG: hypothetical protein RLZZ387_966 [Chloroflexota bacterium]|jgi:MFS family permease
MGPMPEPVRDNARVDLVGAMFYGVFFTGSLAFLPVILRRLGASADQLALYVIFTYVGQLLSPLSVALVRRRDPLRFSVLCWALARASLVLGAVIADAWWLLALAALYWVLEMLPAPAYAGIVQQIYPARYRGRAMSGVRVGMVVVVLATTPLAGWLLDQLGHQALLPVAALFGVLSSLTFGRVRVPAADPPDAAPRAPDAEPDARPAAQRRGVLDLIRSNRPFAIYLAAMTVYGLGGVMALPLYPVVQVTRLGLSYTEIGVLGLAQSATWLLGFLYWGRLLDRRGAVWVLRVNMGLAALVPLTYIFAGNAWALLPAFLAQGLIQGGFELGVTNTAIGLAERGRVMEYTALQTAVIGLRGMAAPLIGAALLGAGTPDTTVFGLSVALVLAGWVMMGYIRSDR